MPTEIETINVITSNYISSSYEGNMGMDIQPAALPPSLLEYYNPISIDEPSVLIEEETRETNNSSSSSHDNIFIKPPFLIQARPSHTNTTGDHHRDIANDHNNNDDNDDDDSAKLTPLQSKVVNIFPTRELMMSRVTVVKPEPDPTLEADKTADSSPPPTPSISEPQPAPAATSIERGLEGELVSLLGTVIQSQQTVNKFFKTLQIITIIFLHNI